MSISKPFSKHNPRPASTTNGARPGSYMRIRARPPSQFDTRGRRVIRSRGEADPHPLHGIHERAARAHEARVVAAAAELERESRGLARQRVEEGYTDPEDLHRSPLDPYFTPMWVVLERVYLDIALREKEAAERAEREGVDG